MNIQKLRLGELPLPLRKRIGSVDNKNYHLSKGSETRVKLLPDGALPVQIRRQVRLICECQRKAYGLVETRMQTTGAMKMDTLIMTRQCLDLLLHVPMTRLTMVNQSGSSGAR